MYLHLL